MLRNSILLTLLLCAITPSFGQTARVQILHNSPDTALRYVDVWLNNTLLLNDFEFRTASTFLDAPAGIPIEIRIADSSSIDTANPIAVFHDSLGAGETYIIAASGLVSAGAYLPFVPFDLHVFAMGQEMAAASGNTDLLLYNGSTDAPMIDINETKVIGSPIANGLSFGQYNGYLNLENDDYRFRLLDAGQSSALGEYEAPLATFDLEDSALVVLASGFINPATNSSGAKFGLFVAMAGGGEFVPLDRSRAYVQVIHNAADSSLDTVDVYLNNQRILNDITFRSASAFLEVPSAVELSIAIAGGKSTSNASAFYDTVITAEANTSYALVANGLVDTGYASFKPFQLYVSEVRQEANFGTNNDVLVFHGSTDAPAVSVRESAVLNTSIVQAISYGMFSDYNSLPTANYQLEVTDSGADTLLYTYQAPLAALNLDGEGLLILASGFINPVDSFSTKEFGLWVARPSGGALVELPITTGVSGLSNQANVNIYPNPANSFLQVSNLHHPEEITIADLNGRVVRTLQPTSDTFQINVSDLPRGIYILRIAQNGHLSNHKVVIQ